MSHSPSGAQHRMSSGDQEVIVVEVGGGLRSYTAGGVDVLDGYGEDEMADGGRGQHLLPWPNRIRDGRYHFGGADLQLPLTEPARHNASHGLVRWANWAATVVQPDRVVMELVLHPQPGYPFTLGLSVEYRLGPSGPGSGTEGPSGPGGETEGPSGPGGETEGPSGLSVATTATNLGGRPCPYGAGAHPYVTVGTEQVDDAVLEVPAGARLEADDRGIPTGAVPVEGTPFDFRAAAPVADLVIDHAYTDLTGDRAVLATADGRRRVALWWDRSYRWLMVFTGDTLQPARRRRSVALEPMTCPPNAFVTGEGLRVLEPEESWTTTWGIAAGPPR